MTITQNGDAVNYSKAGAQRTADVVVPISTLTDYQSVAVSQTDKVLGATGAAGDFLDHIVIFVATAATAAVTIKDGSTTVASFANSPGGGIGAYNIPLGIRSVSGAFKITTGAGSTVLAVGDFT